MVFIKVSYGVQTYNKRRKILCRIKNCSWCLIRNFYPKRTDFRKHTEQELLELQNILNNRPRKTLGYKTPVQVMVQHMMTTE